MRDYCPKMSGLPRDLWRRTVNFIRGYDRIKDDLDYLIQQSHDQDGQPRGTDTSDPTATIVIAREHLRKELDAIEDARRAIPSEWRDAVFLSIKDERPLYSFPVTHYTDPKTMTRLRSIFVKQVAINMGWWYRGMDNQDW